MTVTGKIQKFRMREISIEELRVTQVLTRSMREWSLLAIVMVSRCNID